jgi:hypothetical protein
MNEVHLRGQIKRIWTYSDNLYLRLSVRRAPGRPKRSPREGGPYDYVPVVFPDARDQLRFAPGQTLTIHGWLQSRDFDESLADFLKRAGATLPDAPKGVTVHRTVTEIVAERWRVHKGER